MSLDYAVSKWICAGVLALCITTVGSAQDPPTRIARLNYASGNISMQPAGLEEWTPAELNRPFTTGDQVFTDLGSRAEFHLDSAVIRAGESTSFRILALNDKTVQLSLAEGDLYVNLRELDLSQNFEIDSPNASISLLRPGFYRFRIAADGDMTFVVVRQGQSEVTGGGQAVNLTPGSSAAISGSANLAYDVEPAPSPDDFDHWSQDRDAAEARSASARYLPRYVIGYEDMDRYGSWETAGDYGTVWYPSSVSVGWAPYHNGHWAWVEPWGWTWVDDAPWGFAPFHYGRWAFIGGRWGWCPGPIVIVANHPPPPRPVYAPALVAWFGGPHFGVSIRIGGGEPSLGWVPLGVGEVYTPSYHCSPNYFNNVNVSNTTVVKTVNITSVYNTVYVNKTVYVQNFANTQAPNAVTAMPHSAFASGRPVAQAGVSVAPAQVKNIQVETASIAAPSVAPTRQALLASNSTAPTVKPPAAIMQRKVAGTPPPVPAPQPFAVRQAYLQQHAGEVHNSADMQKQNVQPSPAVLQKAPAPQVAKVATPPPPPAVAPKPATNNLSAPPPAASHTIATTPAPREAVAKLQAAPAAYPERKPQRPVDAAKPEHKDKGKDKDKEKDKK